MGSRLVLVVDAQEAVRALIASALRAEGCVVRTASDGLDALEQMDRLFPDVLVLDLDLPRLDGEGLLLELLNRGWLSRLRVVIVTARRHDLLKFEPYQVVTKPVDLDELLDAIGCRD